MTPTRPHPVHHTAADRAATDLGLTTHPTADRPGTLLTDVIHALAAPCPDNKRGEPGNPITDLTAYAMALNDMGPAPTPDEFTGPDAHTAYAETVARWTDGLDACARDKHDTITEVLTALRDVVTRLDRHPST